MNADVKKILQKALDCLSDTEYLLSDNRLEAACNRAYYAIFDAIQAILVNENIATKSHQGVHTKFREMFLKTNILPPELNDILSDSFNMRQGSDYDSDFEISKEDVKRILDEATFFVNTVQTYLTNVSSL